LARIFDAIAMPPFAIMKRREFLSLTAVVPTDAVSPESVERTVASAKKVGFLKGIPDLAKLLPKL
jgi:hypothetical protein